jgi:hypothetical protein
MTHSEYTAGVEILKSKAPEHPLLSTLQTEYSKLNELYLVQALKSIDFTINPDNKEDLQLKNLFQQKSRLAGRRAILSNSFHDCKSDFERAKVSEEIQQIQFQISGINKKIREYEETGELISDSRLENLPEDLFELYKIKENARKNIPRLEKAIEDLYQLPENAPNRTAKIEEKETKLTGLKILKSYVEKLIKDKDLQSH